MHIKLKISHGIWHEKDDMINIKFMLFFSLLIIAFIVSAGISNKVFIYPWLQNNRILPQKISMEYPNIRSFSFTKVHSKVPVQRPVADYVRLDIPQLIEKLDDATPVHQRLSLFCPSTHGVEAANQLSKLGTKAVEPLITALHDPRPSVRGNAALALGFLNYGKANKAIIALFDDANPVVRMKTAMALTSMDAPEVTDALINALKDKEAEVRAEAVRALAWREDNNVKRALQLVLQKDRNWLVRSEVEAALQ